LEDADDESWRGRTRSPPWDIHLGLPLHMKHELRHPDTALAHAYDADPADSSRVDEDRHHVRRLLESPAA
jgi:hypothetical protein